MCYIFKWINKPPTREVNLRKELKVLLIAPQNILRVFLLKTIKEFIDGKVLITPALDTKSGESHLQKRHRRYDLVLVTCSVESNRHDATTFMVKTKIKHPGLRIILMSADPIARKKADLVGCRSLPKSTALKLLKRRLAKRK